MKKRVSKQITLVISVVAVIALNISCSNDDNLYRIQKDGLYGFIDKTGKIVIEPQYDYVGKFTNDGFALIILDANITPIEYVNPIGGRIMTDTVLKVSYNYIDMSGKKQLSSNEEIFLRNAEPWLLYNDPQEFVSKFKSHTFGFREYVLSELDMDSDRYLFQNEEYLIGYKNKTGNVVIKPVFCYGRSMENGMTFVIESLKALKEDDILHVDILKYMNDIINSTRLINVNGKYISEMSMHDFSDFNKGGYSWVSVAHYDTAFTELSDWFRIDRTGHITCGPVSAYGGTVLNNYHSDDPLYVVSFSWGIIGTYYTWVDDKGNYLTDYNHDHTVELSFSGDSQNELFTAVTAFSEGVAGVRKFNSDGESAWLFVDKEMNIMSDPYDSIIPFKNGLAAVQEKIPRWHSGKWGFVGFDVDSSIVQKIPFNFSEVSSFNKDGLAYAAIRGTGFIKEGYINKHGEFVWETLRKID